MTEISLENKLYVVEQYESCYHTSFPVSYHCSLSAAQARAVSLCPLPLQWADWWTNVRGERILRAEETADIERDPQGYLPRVLPSDFSIREVTVER